MVFPLVFLPLIQSSTVLIDDPTPPEKLPCTVNTFVRPLDRFPPNFESQAKSNDKGMISPVKNERMLLSSLLGACIMDASSNFPLTDLYSCDT